MILKKTIPKDFYKLFRTRNMDAYMMFLVSIYDENNEVYTALGLTIEDGQAIIGEVCSKMQIEWMEDSEEAPDSAPGTPSAILNTLIRWGWIKSDYDEQLDTYILSFPEYSQLYVELFKKLQSEDDSRERESILSIYSALFTYQAEPEKNNGILRSALATSKNLETLLSNMQNGMRAYFDVLSASRNFIQIQQVLVEEINNSDSQRYAILTTTDSFYRYKESVKELISQILSQHDLMKTELSRTLRQSTANTPEYTRAETALRYSDEAVGLIYKIERQFDLIERKYNKLVEQKAVFAKRALARIHYIFQEGAAEEDSVIRLLHLIEKSPEPERILGALGTKIYISLEDDLMRLFGGDRITNMMERFDLDEDTPIENKMLTKAIENAQTTVESRNFQSRKSVLEYDDVMNKQRELIYSQRRQVLDGMDIKDTVLNMMHTSIGNHVSLAFGEKPHLDAAGYREMLRGLEGMYFAQGAVSIPEGEVPGKSQEDFDEAFIAAAESFYENKEAEITSPIMRELERVVMLRVVDEYWMDHIDAMDDLKQGIRLQSYGNNNPVDVYKRESLEMFEEMIAAIQDETVRRLYSVRLRKDEEVKRERVAKGMVENVGGDGTKPKKQPLKVVKIGRNDPCPCGSGLKWKKCTCPEYHQN